MPTAATTVFLLQFFGSAKKPPAGLQISTLWISTRAIRERGSRVAARAGEVNNEFLNESSLARPLAGVDGGGVGVPSAPTGAEEYDEPLGACKSPPMAICAVLAGFCLGTNCQSCSPLAPNLVCSSRALMEETDVDSVRLLRVKSGEMGDRLGCGTLKIILLCSPTAVEA